MDLSKFKYDHPRGRFKTYFNRLQEQVYKHSETGQVSWDFFEEFKRQINNLSIPEEWKSKYCFENINGRLERIFEKKTGYRDISEVPVHEIFEYAQILLQNYYEQEENKSYEEVKKIFEDIKNKVHRNINLRALDEKLGIGDYFVQRVDDKVELIYNLGDGYVATLPLQKKKIEEVLDENVIPPEKKKSEIQQPAKDINLNDSMELDEFARTIVEDWVNDRFQKSLRQDLSSEVIEFLVDFYEKGFIDGHNSIISDLRYAPLPEFIYYTPKMMNIDVKKFIDKAIDGFENYNKKFKKPDKEMTSGEFAGIVKQALVEQDKEELSKALRS